MLPIRHISFKGMTRRLDTKRTLRISVQYKFIVQKRYTTIEHLSYSIISKTFLAHSTIYHTILYTTIYHNK